MREVQKHDIVQFVPEHQWAGCLATVTEVKSFGMQGFVQIPMQGAAYIRANHDDYEIVGKAEFVLESENNE